MATTNRLRPGAGATRPGARPAAARPGQRPQARPRPQEEQTRPPRRAATQQPGRAPARKASGRKGFVYKPRSPDSVKQQAERQGGAFDSILRPNIDRFTTQQGANNIRILPPTWDDHDDLFLHIWVHSYVGPDESTYLCPRKMQNKPCLICDAAVQAKQDGEVDEEKALKAKERCLCWIVNRDADNPEVPQVWDCSWSQAREVNSLCYSKKTGKVLQIDNPDEGYDLTFSRQGTRLNTRYFGYSFDRDPSPIFDDPKEQDSVLDFINENPIPDLLVYKSPEQLAIILSGTAAEDDEDLDPSAEEYDANADAVGEEPPEEGGEEYIEEPAEEEGGEEYIEEGGEGEATGEEEYIEEEEEEEEGGEEEAVEEAPPPPRRATAQPRQQARQQQRPTRAHVDETTARPAPSRRPGTNAAPNKAPPQQTRARVPQSGGQQRVQNNRVGSGRKQYRD